MRKKIKVKNSSSITQRYDQAASELANLVMNDQSFNLSHFQEYQRKVSSKYGLDRIIGNTKILSLLPSGVRSEVLRILKLKPVRTASGIAVVAVMTKPHACPHGVCLYCPGGVKKGTPQSYTGLEPSSRRAVQNDYDSFKQVTARLSQLSLNAHSIQKSELIIIGGTFTALPYDKQESFVKGCFDGFNQRVSSSLAEAHRIAESSPIRNVGFTVETRPDLCKEEHVDQILSLGATRVELGVQALNDDIYKAVNRGHSVKDVIDSFRIAKDSGLKIVAHMMPGLPGSSIEEDYQTFKTLMFNNDFKPDMLKIYPTLVTKDTGIYDLYNAGKYEPYTLQEAVKLLANIKELVPPWIRIMRIQREIPAAEIIAGIRSSNLRELAQAELKKRGARCKCIRCREVGLRQKEPFPQGDIELQRHNYSASGGVEVFLSYIHKPSDTLIGFVRLRIPSTMAHRPEIINRKAGLIRELHVYGEALPLGIRQSGAWQHKGLGKKLMANIEEIAQTEFSCEKIIVCSAIGTRQYYSKIGYTKEGPYMVKDL